MPATSETDARPMGRRARRKAETRAALIDAAYALFAEHGFAATTMDEIAERAEVSRRTAFRYFPSKEALVFPERDERLAAFQRLLEEGQGESAFAIVRDACLALAEHYIANAERIHTQWRIVQSEPSLMGRELQLDREYEDAMAHAFEKEERRTVAGRRRARLRAGAVLGMVRVVLRDWLESGTRRNLRALGQEAFALLASGPG